MSTSPTSCREQDQLVPRLPLELEREIFELTARAHRETAVRLTLVAHRVQIWVERVIYHVVSLSDRRKCSAFLRTLDARPPDFFQSHVRAICLPYFLDVAQATRILSVCPEVENLACWAYRPPPRIGLSSPSIGSSNSRGGVGTGNYEQSVSLYQCLVGLGQKAGLESDERRRIISRSRSSSLGQNHSQSTLFLSSLSHHLPPFSVWADADANAGLGVGPGNAGELSLSGGSSGVRGYNYHHSDSSSGLDYESIYGQERRARSASTPSSLPDLAEAVDADTSSARVCTSKSDKECNLDGEREGEETDMIPRPRRLSINIADLFHPAATQPAPLPVGGMGALPIPTFTLTPTPTPTHLHININPNPVTATVAVATAPTAAATTTTSLEPDFTLPLFSKLTHLRIIDPWTSWTGFVHLLHQIEGLTHLALDCSGLMMAGGNLDRVVGCVRGALGMQTGTGTGIEEEEHEHEHDNERDQPPSPACRNLKILILYINRFEARAIRSALEALAEKDERVVVMDYENPMVNWQKGVGVKPGVCQWTLAEERVRGKTRGVEAGDARRRGMLVRRATSSW
ncbi:hypothetical protein AX16_006152 [Volvariella volvacea WC 439]|nr:hypothetical protein AX16_006152 [Volvariella volvacea WC 439]